MKTYLVTGGAGFLGSHLSKKLVRAGHRVLCIDNLSTGNLSNVAELKGDKFIFYNRCVTEEFPDFPKIHGIFNLACPASPKKYQSDSVATIKTNVLGSINVLELAKKLKIPVLQASTSEVYGDPELDILHEEYNGNVNPIGIRSCYDEGKRIAETLFTDYNRQYGVDTKIIRIFNTYGPIMDKEDGRVISNFINQALENKPITIYGDGSQTRSFCYVSDQIEGILKAFNSEGYHKPINIGNPDQRTIKEIAEIIVKKVGSSSEIIYQNLPEDDPKKRFPNIEKAQKLLNWEPIVSLDHGLDLTIDYFKTI
jgi:UDP-glucuronate decarboxylase